MTTVGADLPHAADLRSGHDDRAARATAVKLAVQTAGHHIAVENEVSAHVEPDHAATVAGAGGVVLGSTAARQGRPIDAVVDVTGHSARVVVHGARAVVVDHVADPAPQAGLERYELIDLGRDIHSRELWLGHGKA